MSHTLMNSSQQGAPNWIGHMSISLDLDDIYHEKYQNFVYYFLAHRNQMYVFSTSFILMYNCQLPKYNHALDDQKLHVEVGDKELV